MSLALTLIGLAVLTLLLSLLLPWHIRLTARTDPPEFSASLRLWGGLAPGIPLTGWGRAKPPEAKPEPEPEPEAEPEPAPERRKRRARRKRPRVPKGIGRLVAGIVSAFRLHRLEVEGRIGFEDPADTGAVFGLLAPLIYGVGHGPRRIRIAPEFTAPCLDLSGLAEIAVRPTRLIGAGLRFAWINRAMVTS